MKRFVLLTLVASFLAASFLTGCITLGEKGELQLMPVTLIGKLHQDAKGE